MKRVINMNKRNWIYLASLLVTGLLIVGCDDIIEEDITDENIIITAPLSGATVVSNSVTFQWNTHSGSDEYRVQVNDASNTIVVDSLVATNSFTYPLSPGEYSWRVRGENFAYQTAYTFPATFTMEALEDMTNQEVILTSPNDNVYLNSSSNINVGWVGISTADKYTVRLIKQSTGGIVSTSPDITTISYLLDASVMSTDDEYVWSVKAHNDATQTETLYVNSRSVFIDTVVPILPILETPEVDATKPLSAPVVFDWTNGADPGDINSPVESILEIATDDQFTSVSMVQAYPPSANTTESHTFTTADDYYWRVKNKDAAGNESNYTDPRKITIN